MTEAIKKKLLKISKKNLLLISGLTIGVFLIAFGSGIGNKSTDDPSCQNITGESYSDALEIKLEEFLKRTEGIYDVDVFVTVDGGSENEYVKKGNSYGEDYLVIKNSEGEEAAIVREIYPKVRGVAVICTGGEDPSVQEKVTQLLSAALGISTNKIEVAGIN